MRNRKHIVENILAPGHPWLRHWLRDAECINNVVFFYLPPGKTDQVICQTKKCSFRCRDDCV